MRHALRPDHADQRSHRAARPQVGLELGEQGVERVGPAQERQRRRQHLGEEQGVGGRPIGPGHLEVAVEQPLTIGLGPGDQQCPVDDVDAPGPILIDEIAQRGGLLDGVGHVGQRARADVGGQGVEQQVDGDRPATPRQPRVPPPASCRRVGRPATRRWETATELLATNPLDQVVGLR